MDLSSRIIQFALDKIIFTDKKSDSDSSNENPGF